VVRTEAVGEGRTGYYSSGEGSLARVVEVVRSWEGTMEGQDMLVWTVRTRDLLMLGKINGDVIQLPFPLPEGGAGRSISIARLALR
jgi:hypothetical protein